MDNDLLTIYLVFALLHIACRTYLDFRLRPTSIADPTSPTTQWTILVGYRGVGNLQFDDAAIVGDAKNSLLIKVVTHTGPYEMPPPGKLEAGLIDDLTRWVDAGLPWPAT